MCKVDKGKSKMRISERGYMLLVLMDVLKRGWIQVCSEKSKGRMEKKGAGSAVNAMFSHIGRRR